MVLKMFTHAGIGGAGLGTVGASVGCGISAATAMAVGFAAAPVAIPVLVGGGIGLGVGAIGGFVFGAVRDVIDKSSEVKKTKKEKETEVTKVTKEKDAKITEITQEKTALEKNQADYAAIKKTVEDMKKTDVGVLHAKIEAQNKKIEAQDQKIEAQDQKIEVLEEDNKDLRKEIADLKKENEELKQKVADSDKKILNLENKISLLEKENSRLEGVVVLKDQEIAKLKTELENSNQSKLQTIQKLALNVESQIAHSGNQLTHVMKGLQEMTKNKDGFLNKLEIQKESVGKDLSKEMNKTFPNKDNQTKFQDLISIIEQIMKIKENDSIKTKEKFNEICASAQKVFVNLSSDLRELRTEESQITGKKPENNRISNDKDVLRILDQWQVPTLFDQTEFHLSQIKQINQINKELIAVNS